MTGYAGELIIEWPGTGAAARAVPGCAIALYEHIYPSTLAELADVVSLTLHADAKELLTAELTRERLTGDEDNPVERETSTWLVVGFRERS